MTTAELREINKKKRRKDHIYELQKLEGTYTGKLLYEELEQLEDKAITYEEEREFIRKYANMYCQEKKKVETKLFNSTISCWLMPYEYNITVYSAQNVWWGKGERFYTETELLEKGKRIEIEKLEKQLKLQQNYRPQKNIAPNLGGGIFIYVVLMIISSIFHERILAWVMLTIYFIIWVIYESSKYN